MSRLDELIAELCPNGVEYKEIKECTEKISNIQWAEHLDRTFRYVDLTSVDRETHFIGETISITKENAPSRAQQIIRMNDVLLGTTRPMLKRYCIVPEDFDGEICSTGFCVLRAKEDIVLARFLYHVISTTDFFSFIEKYQKGASYPAISDADVRRYKLPVPPLEVQREIVRVLDNFTLLTAELTAELTARRKQFEYYRYMLLSQKCDNIVETKDVKLDSFWLMPATPKYQNEGVPYITSKNIKNGQIDFNDVKYISKDDYQAISANRDIRKNDLLITMIGTIGEAAFVGDRIEFYGQNIYLVRLDEKMINRKYFYYYLTSPSVKEKLISKKNASSQGYIKAGSIENMSFSLPDIQKQNRIVNVLERFDKLSNDISIGLPAEIAARQKQYEYYRDKLLTFKEAK